MLQLSLASCAHLPWSSEALNLSCLAAPMIDLADVAQHFMCIKVRTLTELLQHLVRNDLLLEHQGMYCISGVMAEEAVQILKQFYEGENPNGKCACLSLYSWYSQLLQHRTRGLNEKKARKMPNRRRELVIITTICLVTLRQDPS